MTLVYDIKDTFVHNIRYSRTVTRKTLQLELLYKRKVMNTEYNFHLKTAKTYISTTV